ncbi:MAG: hypothetical protein OXH93_13035 [Caldilineaceae bacterium]|nr:hypothetical protein [Caldilineaceae bacterium]
MERLAARAVVKRRGSLASPAFAPTISRRSPLQETVQPTGGRVETLAFLTATIEQSYILSEFLKEAGVDPEENSPALDQYLTWLIGILFFLFLLYVILDGFGSAKEEPPSS